MFLCLLFVAAIPFFFFILFDFNTFFTSFFIQIAVFAVKTITIENDDIDIEILRIITNAFTHLVLSRSKIISF